MENEILESWKDLAQKIPKEFYPLLNMAQDSLDREEISQVVINIYNLFKINTK